MLCDDVKASEAPDARQMLPAGAGSARVAAGVEGEAEIRWVGEQYRLQGYCGRASGAAAAPSAAAVTSPRAPVVFRPVVLVQRSRGVVVRIGPRPEAPGERSAKAA